MGTCSCLSLTDQNSVVDAEQMFRIDRIIQEDVQCPLSALNSMPENQTGSLGFRIESAFTLKDLNGLMEHLYGAENLYQSPPLA
jgi:hypothetical protein